MQQNPWRRSLAEKVSFSVSLFIVGIIIFLISYSWITGDSSPPVLSVTTESQSNPRHIGKQYYVPFTVKNSGGETVESVEVVAQLLDDSQILEVGRQQIDFLSRQEERSGEFIFSRDPKQGKLVIRVASYKLP